MLSAAIVFMSLVVIVGVLGSSSIVAFFASGFDAEKLESDDRSQSHHLSLHRFRHFLALAKGVLNSYGRFGASAFAPVLLNLSVIAMSYVSDFFPIQRSRCPSVW